MVEGKNNILVYVLFTFGKFSLQLKVSKYNC